jgi:hypothetical protein
MPDVSTIQSQAPTIPPAVITPLQPPLDASLAPSLPHLGAVPPAPMTAEEIIRRRAEMQVEQQSELAQYDRLHSVFAASQTMQQAQPTTVEVALPPAAEKRSAPPSTPQAASSDCITAPSSGDANTDAAAVKSGSVSTQEDVQHEEAAPEIHAGVRATRGTSKVPKTTKRVR